MSQSHEITIQKVLEYLRSNLAEPLTLSTIAGFAGYSKPWLVEVFLRYTGKGPVSHLAELRIQKAKELLQNTNMRISEIAMASGFSSLGYFGIAFQKATKLSPSDFRNNANIKPFASKADVDEHAPRQWFSDTMNRGNLTAHWRPKSGEWRQENGCICGTGDEEVVIELKRLLPDNFRLSFEVNVEKAQYAPTLAINLLLCGRTSDIPFYQATLHNIPSSGCALHRGTDLAQESLKSQLKEGVWQKVMFALNDDTVQLWLNGEEQISFRDPFPAPYEKRCRVLVTGYRCRLRFRNVKIDDAGFLPFARAIRQADALYNAGLAQEARLLYRRMLETQTNPADSSELNCKTALCCLALDDFLQARQWALKVPPVPASDFWAQQAALVRLEADWRERKIDDLLAGVASLSQRPQIRYHLRGIVQRAATDFDARGFFDDALRLRTSLYDMEEPDSVRAMYSLAAVGDSLIQLNRFESAVAHLQEVAVRGKNHHDHEYWLFSLADALNLSGKSAEAREVLATMRMYLGDASTKARWDIYEAFCCRTEGKLSEALSLLELVPSNHSTARVMAAFAMVSASSIHVSLGQTDQALDLVAQVDQWEERGWFLSRGQRSRYEYPPYFAMGNYAKAAEILLSDSAIDDANVALRCEQAIKAAMILAIDGKKEEGVRILGETIRKFPKTRVHYLGSLASALKEGILGSGSPSWSSSVVPAMENLPYPVRVRSEVFLLASVLLLNWGEKDAGRKLLNAAAEEDRSNLWPAVLAKEKLSA